MYTEVLNRKVDHVRLSNSTSSSVGPRINLFFDKLRSFSSKDIFSESVTQHLNNTSYL